MSQLYIVKHGDTLKQIALRLGFRKWEDLYFHPDNAGFRKRRPNPDRIFPNDVIVIPAGRAPVATPITPSPAAPAWSISPDPGPGEVSIPSLQNLRILQPWHLPVVLPPALAPRAREVARALTDLGITRLDQSSKLDDIAKTIKSYMELKTTNWVISPDLETIGAGLLDLIQNPGALGQPPKPPRHPIDAAIRGE